MLHNYMITNMDWVLNIGKTMKSRSLEDYIDTVTLPGDPINPFCVLVLAHMFHFHIAIFVSKRVWGTFRDRSLKKCRFGLIFHGGTEFSETVKAGESEQYSKFLDSMQQIELSFVISEPKHLKSYLHQSLNLLIWSLKMEMTLCNLQRIWTWTLKTDLIWTY